MWRAAKVCFLYIGTVIGAGFASGREIALFFGDTAPLNVALAAAFMAIPEALFLTAGKLGVLPDNTAVRTGVFIAAFSSVAAMLAGCDLALYDVTGVVSLGVIAAILAGVLVVGGMEKIKLANTLLIPLLLALLLAVYIKSGAPVFNGSYSIVKPVHYAGLDVLMGGMVISREGRKLKGKEIALTCVFSTLFLGMVLFVLQNIVLSDDFGSSMPVLAVAEGVGLKIAAGILIVIAVFTTLVSSLDVLTESARRALGDYAAARTPSPENYGRGEGSPENLPADGRASAASAKRRPFLRFAAFYSAPRNRAFAVFLNLALLYPVSFFGFDAIVDALYPFVGLCGILMTVYTAFNLFRFVKSRRDKPPRRPRAAPHGGNAKRRTAARRAALRTR